MKLDSQFMIASRFLFFRGVRNGSTSLNCINKQNMQSPSAQPDMQVA